MTTILTKRGRDEFQTSLVNDRPNKYYRLTNIIYKNNLYNIDNLDDSFNSFKNIIDSIPECPEHRESKQYGLIIFQIIKNIINNYQNNINIYNVDSFYQLISQIKAFYYSLILTYNSILKYLIDNRYDISQLYIEFNNITRSISYIIEQKYTRVAQDFI